MSETPANTPPPATPAEWTSALSDEQKAYVTNKGFKAVGDVVHSYLNLEKLHSAGPDKLLKLPDSMDTPEAMAVWDRLGRPKDPKDYGFDSKVVPEHVAKDFHEIGVTKDQASKILAKQTERAKAAEIERVAASKAKFAQDDLVLRKEWGAAYDQNCNIIKTVTQTLGLSQDEVTAMGSALGVDKAMKTLLGLGMKTGEATFVSGNGGGVPINTPDSAKMKIAALKQDVAWVDKYLNGDVAARKTMQDLMAEAYPGQQTI